MTRRPNPNYLTHARDLVLMLMDAGCTIERYQSEGAFLCSWRCDPPLMYTPEKRRVDHTLITTVAEVEDAYDHPDVFWSIWDGRHDAHGQVFLWRGLELVEAEQWLPRKVEDMFKLARAAKPGRTKHFKRFTLAPINRDYFLEHGTPILRFVGYTQADQTVTYSAVCEPHQHVLPRTYWLLRRMRVTGLDSENRPVKQVKVHFATEAMARREKRLLLDIDVQVFYLHPDGRDVQLTT